MSSAYSNSPHFSTQGAWSLFLVFVGASGLGKSTSFRASAPSRGFIFQAQARHPVAAAQIGPEAAHLLHDSKKVRASESPSPMPRARPGARSYRQGGVGPPAVLQFRHVARLEFFWKLGRMRRGAGPRSSTAISADAAERPMDVRGQHNIDPAQPKGFPGTAVNYNFRRSSAKARLLLCITAN
jgi:hypothetical protein